MRSQWLCGLVVCVLGGTLVGCGNTTVSELGTGVTTTTDPATPADGGTTTPGSDDGSDDGDDAQDEAFTPGPNEDAFWEDDPPPAYCGPNAEQEATLPGGTRACPDDKNREGCPCDVPGETRACWPGLRVQRNRGQCKDGVAECIDIPEFGPQWGPCEGYVLPGEGFESGPAACECFSRGVWAIDNIVPCIARVDDPGSDDPDDRLVYLSSTGKDSKCASGNPPMPETAWSDNRLTVDCAGQFNLCFTLKGGRVDDPQDSDCVLAELCVDVWYPEPNQALELPELPAWNSEDSACGQRFVEVGGYAEMSVQGVSVDCEEVGDGNGGRRVFHRNGYCPLECKDNPDAPGCESCVTGGSGEFMGN